MPIGNKRSAELIGLLADKRTAGVFSAEPDPVPDQPAELRLGPLDPMNRRIRRTINLTARQEA